jgi:hypothetical protein
MLHCFSWINIAGDEVIVETLHVEGEDDAIFSHMQPWGICLDLNGIIRCSFEYVE